MTAGPPVLVTGAAGVVGRACVQRMAKAGREVIAIVREGGAGGLPLNLADPALDLSAVTGQFACAPEAIVHIAAVVPNDPRYPDNDASAQQTRQMDRNIARLAERLNARVIYMSGCSLYDRAAAGPKRLGSPLAANLGPYLAAKLAGEELFRDVDATILRLSAPVGAGLKPSAVFALFCERARAGETIKIWGSGSREQDFIHVDDVADLLVTAATHPVAGTFNCARGVPTTMLELAEAIVSELGCGQIEMVERPDPGEGETARYDIAATRQQFGWAPTRGLAEMIRSL